MITDAMLSKVAEEANQIILDSLPSPQECNHRFSTKFERKMKRQFTKANHPQMCCFFKQVACFVLALAIGGATLLAVNGEVRAAFWGWVKEQYETLISYRFIGETTSPDGLENYELAIIPDGYTEIDKQHTEMDGYSVYMNESGDILQFVYAGNYENIAIYVKNVDYNKTNILINNIEADLYTSNNENNSPAVIWIDRKQNVTFLVSGYLDIESLIELAENVVVQD